MGRAKTTAQRRRDASRRRFLQHAGSAALVVGAVPWLSACGGRDDPDPVPDSGGVFRHGVASGDPLSDRVVLWTRVTPATAGAVTLECIVAADAAFALVVSRTMVGTDASRDYTVKLDATGLQPGTSYYYRFSTGGAMSPIGRTRTLPATGAAPSTARLRMAVVSCANLAAGYFNAYARVAERADLDLVVHLGDYIYEYPASPSDIRVVEPPVETVTLTDYRARYAHYRLDPDLQELHRQHPVIAIWDDHDIASNANATGSQNHSESTEGPWPARVAAAVQARNEWLPVRVADPADPRRDYRSFAYGDLVELMMLEERVLARSPQVPPNAGIAAFTQTGAFADPAREMLGPPQLDWLAERLRTSSATWKLIGQGVMVAQLKIVPATNDAGGGKFVNPDQWDGYQPARDRLFQAIEGSAAAPAPGNVVVLTGDAHSSWAADLTRDPNSDDPAVGGYDPATGAGASAVEFVATSVSSLPFLDLGGLAASSLQVINPHFKYIELSKRGYMLVDADPSRVVSEWWYVDSVATRNGGQSFGAAMQVLAGVAHVVPAGPTSPRTNPPAPAP